MRHSHNLGNFENKMFRICKHPKGSIGIQAQLICPTLDLEGNGVCKGKSICEHAIHASFP